MRPPYPGHLLWDAANEIRAAGLSMERRFFGAAMAAVDVGSVALLHARGFESRWVETSVGRMHVIEALGEGPLPPVAVLHGLGSCGADYAGLIDALRSRVRRVVAPDLFGHGLSPRPRGGMQPSMLASGVEEALREILDEPTVFMGNSMGGLEAVRVASMAPELARGIFLASPGGAPMAPADLEAFFQSFCLDSRREALDFVDRFLGRPHALRPVLAFGVQTRMASPAIRELLDRVGPQDMLTPAEVSGIQCPAFLFWGADDDVLPAGQRQFFLDNLPSGTPYASPGRYGHAPQMDDLGGFARYVLRFIESLE